MGVVIGHRERMVSANGLRFHCVEWGDPQARPIVLLHGITGHARTWDRLAHDLAHAYRVIAIDQRGHGDSQAPPDGEYDTPLLAQDLGAIVDALGLGAFALLGLSMGGRVAMAFAGTQPARVERLVIVDIGPDIHLPGLQRVRGMMAGASERIESVEQAVEYVRRANPRYDAAELRRRVEHGLKQLPDGGLAWKYDRALREMMRSGVRRDDMDLWGPLARIPCPTLVVRGAESDILSPEIADKMLRALPHGTLVEIPDAGHTVPGDQPAAFARAVRAFLGA
ncbi:MAG TPA: alpha/beta hydrolase [Vicinamibacteria bacterium]|nr:alpha/beta hydrolase [Vicinamibacteria bacterium]